MRISQNAIFGSGAKGYFLEHGMYGVMAFLNSKVTLELLQFLSPTLNYEAGHIANLPVCFQPLDGTNIEKIVRDNIALSKSDWDSFETSWDFARHPLLTYGATLLSDAFAQWQATCEERFLQLKSNEEELNRIFIDIYGLGAELSPEVAEKDVTVARIFDTAEDIPAAMKGNAYVLTRADVARSLVSYAVGCMFGRYSLDEDGLVFAGGTWDAGRYQTFVPDRDAILPVCDDDYFEDDLVNCYERWLAAAFGKDSVDANLRWTAEALGLKGTPRETLRDYFLHGFYADHLRRYQSRPIYWLCDAGKKDSFKALMYLHRYDRDTMARLRMGYVYKQQKLYEAKIELFTQRVATAASTAEKNRTKKTLKKLQDQFTEIKAYEEKVHHFADSRIVIDLDDGVKRNYEIFKDVLGKMKR